MPIYEYRCQECCRISSFLVLNLKEPFIPVCERCGSQFLERILSRVHVRLSEETRMERLADPAQWGGLDESDPKSMARFMKKMGQEMGEDFPGEVDQMVDEAMESLGGPDAASCHARRPRSSTDGMPVKFMSAASIPPSDLWCSSSAAVSSIEHAARGSMP